MHIIANLIYKVKTGELAACIGFCVVGLILKLSIINIVENHFVKIRIDFRKEYALEGFFNKGIYLGSIGQYLKHFGFDKNCRSHKICNVLCKIGYSAVAYGSSVNSGRIENLFDEVNLFICRRGILTREICIKRFLPYVVRSKTSVKYFGTAEFVKDIVESYLLDSLNKQCGNLLKLSLTYAKNSALIRSDNNRYLIGSRIVGYVKPAGNNRARRFGRSTRLRACAISFL